MNSNWSQDKCMQLIFEYRNNDVLWHSRHNAFYNSTRKELIWNDIAEKLCVDVDDVKKKIESLRGSYRREKNREKKSILKGKAYISNWFAYNYMKFLDYKNETYTIPEANVEGGDVIKSECETFEGENSDDFKDLADDTRSLNDTENFEEFGNNKNKRKRLRGSWDESMVNDSYSMIQNVNTTFDQKDECSIFGEFIAVKLRKFNDRLRTELQHKINNIIYETEISIFDSQPQVYNNQQSQSHCSRQTNTMPQQSSSQLYDTPQQSSTTTECRNSV